MAGIVCFNVGMTLRSGDREHYYGALDRLFPGMSDWYRRRYGDAYEVVSDNSAVLMGMFHAACERRGVLHTPQDCFRYTGELPDRSGQMTLF